MSFGWSVSDVAALAQLAWQTVQNARKACGEFDELTREVFGLHVVLRRLENEVKSPESSLSRGGVTCGEKIEAIAAGCRSIVQTLDKVLEKFNALSEKERSGRKLAAKIRFGNGKMGDLVDLRTKITYYTSALSLYLNMVAAGSMGRIEKQMEAAGGDLKELKVAVTSITAKLMAGSDKEGSLLTSYADDDKAVWREFGRELVKDGFSSSSLKRHKVIIKAYFEELGRRGFLDEENSLDNAEHQDSPNFDAETGPSSTVSCEYASGKLRRDSTSVSEFDPELEVLTQPPQSSQSKASVSSAPLEQHNGRTPMDTTSEGGDLHQSDDEFESPHVFSETSYETAAKRYINTSRDLKRSPERLWSKRRERCSFRHWILHDTKGPRFFTKRSLLAKPWGICLVYNKVDVSTLLADFEYRAQIFACELRGPRACRRLVNAATDLDLSTHYQKILKPLLEKMVVLIIRMQRLLYFESKESRETVLHSWSYSTTPDVEQVGFVCTWFLSRAIPKVFCDPEKLSIIRDVGTWIEEFDTICGHITPLSEMVIEGPSNPVILRTQKPHFQDTPLYEWGCINSDYWEDSLEELDEIYSVYRNLKEEYTRGCMQWAKEMREDVHRRIREVLSRVRNDQGARLSQELGQLLLEDVENVLAKLYSLDIRKLEERCTVCESGVSWDYTIYPQYNRRGSLLRLV